MRSLEEMPEVWGSTGRSKEKLKFGAEKSDVPSQNSSKSDPKRGKTKKSGLCRAKNVGEPSKNRPKSGSKRGKAGKTEILERKRRGGVEAKKRT